ncbi:uncharacterized protein [Argopecten irradians]|uniref:uncharacterized protein n=1 Tax=Argopecten irradians TaxID=31199 RepID=UPI0037184BB5
MNCTKHPGSQIVSVCVTCGNTLVCVECMTDSLHKGHVFEKLREVSINIKANLKPKQVEYRRFASSLESDINEMMKIKEQQENDQKERVKIIDKQKEEIIDAATKMAESLKSEFAAETQNNCVQLQRGIDKVSEKLDKVKQHSDNVKRVIDEQDDITVINDSQKLEDTDGTRDPLPKLETIDFTPGKVNDRQLKLMFGGTASEMEELASLQGAQMATGMSLSTYKGSDFLGNVIRQGRELVPITSFQHSTSTPVTQMCCSCLCKSWIKCLDQREITLKTKHGQKKKTVKFNSAVHGMTTVNDDTLLICGYEDRDIKQVKLSTGKVTSLFSTGKLYPRYICMSPGGDLYVTLMDQYDYNVTADSERVLVRYSRHGQEKGRARHDGRGDVLFIYPGRVRTNGGVVGVVNGTDKYNSHLVLLNSDLTLRLRYLGNGKVVSGEEKFDTTTYKPDTDYFILDSDFIFDSLGNIIICEAYSRSVQLLSRDCVPMTTILPTQDYVPWAITITTDDEVWLGFKDGTVKVYKYT